MTYVRYVNVVNVVLFVKTSGSIKHHITPYISVILQMFSCTTGNKM